MIRLGNGVVVVKKVRNLKGLRVILHGEAQKVIRDSMDRADVAVRVQKVLNLKALRVVLLINRVLPLNGTLR